ncbi:MAG: hypothetical protein ABSC76_00255 [Terracidiphilus sp.]|jgi:hypothetical protein
MKRSILVILLLVSATAWAEKVKPNPADYTVAVHVRSSHLLDDCNNDRVFFQCPGIQHLIVVIDAKTYELAGAPEHAEVLRIGDYKAKIVQDGKPQDYEYRRIYEFLFPDGTTRRFWVVGEE